MKTLPLFGVDFTSLWFTLLYLTFLLGYLQATVKVPFIFLRQNKTYLLPHYRLLYQLDGLLSVYPGLLPPCPCPGLHLHLQNCLFDR